MVYSANLLTTKSIITNRKVHLPNGATASVTHIGSIHFADFVLQNVLCVPSFKLNLISISKLVLDSQCLATFTNNTCVLQDQRSGKMIGMGTERGGLYYLDTSQKSKCNVASSPTPHLSNLWHKRLGHPSNKVSSLFPFSIIENKICNVSDCLICPLAKQTRSPFQTSFIHSKVPFELIHVDI